MNGNIISLRQQPHRRFNPLTGEWVMVSPHRTQRPWQGETTSTAAAPGPSHDPACYLCPGNKRANGETNPAYTHTFAFQNDYSALLPDTPVLTESLSPLLQAESVRGLCRVLCFDPDHSLTLARMPIASLERVVFAWQLQFAELAALDWVRHIQIFENRGAMMGASNPHPHGQIWATGFVPDAPAREAAAQSAYMQTHSRCMLCDYLETELRIGERILCRNDEFVAVVPYWAVWPFEALLLPTHHVSTMLEMSSSQSTALADILSQLTIRYDNLFQTSFPYTMGFHQGVINPAAANNSHHFHAHFYPPLLRSATVRKFMVGFEMLGMPQRDITPESAAERLRAVAATHYTQI